MASSCIVIDVGSNVGMKLLSERDENRTTAERFLDVISTT